jgi:hypothetical protein
MAFLRFSRDKRGYEHFYLVEATTNRRGKTRTRVLYWFRTPPNVKVGREPFDDDVRRALESQNPGVAFDWRKIVETPIPSADADRWRERRRAEKAERASRRETARHVEDVTAAGPERAEAPGDAGDFGDLGDPGDIDNLDAAGEIDAIDADAPEMTLDAAEQQADALAPTEESLVAAAASIDPAICLPPTSATESPRKRRRRRRRRRPSHGAPPEPGKPPET